MTQDELDALPVNPTGPDYIRETDAVTGITTLFPSWPQQKVMLVRGDDFVAIEDRYGNVWMTGWIDGVQYKQRQRAFG